MTKISGVGKNNDKTHTVFDTRTTAFVHKRSYPRFHYAKDWGRGLPNPATADFIAVATF
jgi:hypothetical protein